MEEDQLADKSVERLRAYSSDHLRYEITMLQETARRLLHDAELHRDVVLKNAMVESCLVHARALTKFIYPGDDARKDDVTSDDYSVDKPTWAETRGAMSTTLVAVNVRTAKEIAHLTIQRLADDDPKKPWPLVEIIEELHVLLKTFVAGYAARDRLDPLVSDFITGLRSPMEKTTPIQAYNSGSTEIIAATKPVVGIDHGVWVDVRTTSPTKPWAGGG